MWYYLALFFESLLAVFGIRAPFEQPRYTVVRSLGHGVEIRDYAPRTVAQTPADGDAFQRLFAYIAGGNAKHETIAMTTPVQESGGRLGAPAARAVQGSSEVTGGEAARPLMRFDLPSRIAGDPPSPSNPQVTIERLPAQTVAAIRFSGWLGSASIARHARELEQVLDAAGVKIEGAPYVLGYDPPFTIPFLRRNEVAVDVKG